MRMKLLLIRMFLYPVGCFCFVIGTVGLVFYSVGLGCARIADDFEREGVELAGWVDRMCKIGDYKEQPHDRP